MRRLLRVVCLPLLVLAAVSCGSNQPAGFADGADGGGGGGAHVDGGGRGGDARGANDGAGNGPDVITFGSDAGVVKCDPTSSDLAGCTCTAGTTQACYPTSVDPKTRNVGTCKDGMQTCPTGGEIHSFGACTGAIMPTMEDCAGNVDNNCNGKLGCADPACATDPHCNTGCTDGQTRSCYTGPAGSDNVGLCRDGKQTCAGSMWPADCPGEVLPAMENCSDAQDHNCNGLPGCLDFFACLTSPACQGTCTASMLDTGCVCPQGTGDTATCPEGSLGVSKGGSLTSPGMEECCPCTANDCGNAGCCGETVCAGNSQCAGLTCVALPASCNGQVNADCDDFPEDCDEPCCKCTMCP